MKYVFSFILILFLILNGNVSGQSPVKVDISEAIKKQTEFKMSDLISKVELITLKSDGKLLLGGQPEILFFGRKHILMGSEQGSKIGLYDRSGMLKTTIGRVGKGPGEYLDMVTGTIDPLGKYVVLYDQLGMKLILFDIDGRFIREKKVVAPRQGRITNILAFIDTNTFGLMMMRPPGPTNDYASILLFNLKLDPVGKSLQRANDSHLPRFNYQFCNFSNSPVGPVFFELLSDTLYRINADGSAKPLFYFEISKTKLPESLLQDPQLHKKDPKAADKYIMVQKALLTSDYVIAFVGGSFGGLVFTNLMDGRTFSTSLPCPCAKSSPDYKMVAMLENDLFGTPNYFDNFWPEANAFVNRFPAFVTNMAYNLDCIRKLTVKLPGTRNALLSVIEQELYDDEVVLIVQYLK
jgi:hypothetical protein